MRYALFFGLLAALNLMDYGNLGDPFRDGKIRWMFFLLGPMGFFYLRRYLTFAPAAFFWLATYSYSLHDYMRYAGFAYIQIILVLGLAVGVVGAGRDILSKALIWSGCFQAGYGFLQLLGIQLLYTPLKAENMHTPVGLWGHETVLGPFLVACLCPALWKRNWAAATLITFVAAATASSMTLASLGAVYLIFAWHRCGFKAFAIGSSACLAALGGAFLVTPDSGLLNFNGRWVIWSKGFEAFLERPLLGHGIGSWAGPLVQKYAQFYDKNLMSFPRQLHMDYLDFLVEYGLVGAVPMFAAGMLFVRNFSPTWTHAVCVGLLVNALANFPLCLPPLALIFIVCWAHSMRNVTMDSIGGGHGSLSGSFRQS